jgi:hypothetical protein
MGKRNRYCVRWEPRLDYRRRMTRDNIVTSRKKVFVVASVKRRKQIYTVSQ